MGRFKELHKRLGLYAESKEYNYPEDTTVSNSNMKDSRDAKKAGYPIQAHEYVTGNTVPYSYEATLDEEDSKYKSRK